MEVAISSFQGLMNTNSSRRVKHPGPASIIPLKRGISEEDPGIRHGPQVKVERFRARSDNPYLRTAIRGSKPIQTECYTCGTLIGEDGSPSYITLPPFRGFYLAPNTERCPAKDCKRKRQSRAVPVDTSIDFILYNDIADLKQTGDPIYEKLRRIVCEGDKSVSLLPEELNMPNRDFSARKQKRLDKSAVRKETLRVAASAQGPHGN
jgi:hypothetical protein